MRWNGRGAVALAVALIAGCSAGVTGLDPGDGLDAGPRSDAADRAPDAASPDSGAGPDAGPGEDAGRVFHGTAGITWAGSEFLAHDLRDWHITARARRGDGWGEPIVGEGRVEGTFSIPVPAGQLRVEVVPPPGFASPFDPLTAMAVVTRANQVYLRPILPHREAPVQPAGTTITVRGRLARPWASGDVLGLLFGNDGDLWRVVPVSDLAPGVLDVSNRAVDARGLAPYVGGSGDWISLVRWSARPTPFGVGIGISEVSTVHEAFVRPGSDTRLSFETNAPQEQRRVDIVFDATRAGDRSAAHPRAVASHETLSQVRVIRRLGVGDGPAVPLFEIPVVAAPQGAFGAEVQGGPGPWPSCWRYRKMFVLDDGRELEAAASIDCRASDRVRLTLMAPPTELRIGGGDGRTALAGVGFAPSITWTPPADASIDGYGVVLFEGGAVRGQAWTDEPQFDVPPGWMRPGRRYEVQVRVIEREDQAVLTQPRADTLLGRSSSTMSEPFTP